MTRETLLQLVRQGSGGQGRTRNTYSTPATICAGSASSTPNSNGSPVSCAPRRARRRRDRRARARRSAEEAASRWRWNSSALGERAKRLGEARDDRLGKDAGVGERQDAPPSVGLRRHRDQRRVTIGRAGARFIDRSDVAPPRGAAPGAKARRQRFAGKRRQRLGFSLGEIGRGRGRGLGPRLARRDLGGGAESKQGRRNGVEEQGRHRFISRGGREQT